MPNNKKLSETKKLEDLVKTMKDSKCDHGHHHHGNVGNGVYGLGIVGMAVYYFQHMPASSELLMTIVKIVFWPAFLLYHLLEISFF